MPGQKRPLAEVSTPRCKRRRLIALTTMTSSLPAPVDCPLQGGGGLRNHRPHHVFPVLTDVAETCAVAVTSEMKRMRRRCQLPVYGGYGGDLERMATIPEEFEEPLEELEPFEQLEMEPFEHFQLEHQQPPQEPYESRMEHYETQMEPYETPIEPYEHSMEPYEHSMEPYELPLSSSSSSSQLPVDMDIDTPMLSQCQMNDISDKLVSEMEQGLREQCDIVLSARLADQNEALVKFNDDQARRRYNLASSNSYVS